MKISSVSLHDNNLRKNMFIKYSNSFMSMPKDDTNPVEKASNFNDKKVNKSMGIETLTIFPKEVVDGKTIITA